MQRRHSGWKIKINVDETQAKLFYGRWKSPIFNLTIYGHRQVYDKSIRYVGVMLAKRIKFKAQVKM